MGSRVYTFDANTELSDQTAAVTASAAATVDGSAKIIDFGANTRVDAWAVINVTALDIASNDELYTFTIQGSSSASFASDIQNLASISFGATEVRPGGAIDSTVGQYEVGFTNEQDDVIYRYVRLYRTIAGTSPTITSTAFASTIPGD
jgi:D-serine deaminase-like pyridoxal phosphate-dependent protein